MKGQVKLREVVSRPFPGVTIIDRIPENDSLLVEGERFRMEPGDPAVWEVLRVTSGSALVRREGKQKFSYDARVYKTKSIRGRKYKVDTGETRAVEFSRPETGMLISRRSVVERVVEG